MFYGSHNLYIVSKSKTEIGKFDIRSDMFHHVLIP